MTVAARLCLLGLGELPRVFPLVAPHSDAVAMAAIRSLLGEIDAATSAEEIAWAVRKTLEHVAAERPLVVVFDDIQWGEDTFIDPIEHVFLSSGTPLMLLCMTRPEFIDHRPTWPVTLRLEPLNDADVDRSFGPCAEKNDPPGRTGFPSAQQFGSWELRPPKTRCDDDIDQARLDRALRRSRV